MDPPRPLAVGQRLVRFYGIHGFKLIEPNQKRSSAEPNSNRFHRVEGNNLAYFSDSNQIRRPEHRHWIRRLQERKLLREAQPITNRYRHLIWAGSALSSRMGRVEGLM